MNFFNIMFSQNVQFDIKLYSIICSQLSIKVKIQWSRYRPGVAHRVGRGIALLFHDRGTRRGWVISTPRPHFTPGKDPVPIVQEAGWAPGPVWTGGKSRPYRDSIVKWIFCVQFSIGGGGGVRVRSTRRYALVDNVRLSCDVPSRDRREQRCGCPHSVYWLAFAHNRIQ